MHHVTEKHGDMLLIAVTVAGFKYYFRYAYTDQTRAEETRTNLAEGFGKPCGVDLDLANNYRPANQLKDFHMLQRTTQKGSWYVDYNPTVW
jgi:hypothetical protein